MRNPGVLTLPPNCSQTLWSDCPPPSWKLASVADRARIEQQVTKTYLELSKWFILLFIPEHSRVQDQALTPVPLAYSWSQLGQNQGHIQACSHTSVQRALNNVLLPRCSTAAKQTYWTSHMPGVAGTSHFWWCCYGSWAKCNTDPESTSQF